MNLEQPNRENLVFMIDAIKNRLNLVNASMIRPEDFSLEKYGDIRDLYNMMEKKKGNLTMMELEGILQELSELRQN
ncbi:uncharacterized protein YfkK (UPF0435 family) [Melghirimyces profundicolus]|uniref:Uncharacterized protein YfkK (UPF0435 family) n=1 Tax=Melghirimyces profundicolus TaxID=1242148 RepID=A0A2T6BVZ7_9BACL|nr:DUF1128 family protein [Melghirimyces profundicolus]PTX60260.1 uncharacterized protein YfkK (UPF0435 family) [Melghirimyces profundicolus]